MKHTKLLVAGVLLAYLFAGCDLGGKIDASAEIQNTMNQFVTVLNQNSSTWDALKTHVHPEATDYAAANGTFFTASFETGRTYTLSNLNAGDPNGVSGTIGGFTSGSKTFSATFRQDGSRMKLMTMTLSGGIIVLK